MSTKAGSNWENSCRTSLRRSLRRGADLPLASIPCTCVRSRKLVINRLDPRAEVEVGMPALPLGFRRNRTGWPRSIGTRFSVGACEAFRFCTRAASDSRSNKQGDGNADRRDEGQHTISQRVLSNPDTRNKPACRRVGLLSTRPTGTASTPWVRVLRLLRLRRVKASRLGDLLQQSDKHH